MEALFNANQVNVFNNNRENAGGGLVSHGIERSLTVAVVYYELTVKTCSIQQ